jgi:hypothetical protein
VLSFTYGYNIRSDDHPVVKLIQKLNDILVKECTAEKAALLQTFPFGKLHLTLRAIHRMPLISEYSVKYLPSWLPGLGFIKHAAVARQLAKCVWEQPFEYTKSEVVRDRVGYLLQPQFFQGCRHCATIHGG